MIRGIYEKQFKRRLWVSLLVFLILETYLAFLLTKVTKSSDLLIVILLMIFLPPIVSAFLFFGSKFRVEVTNEDVRIYRFGLKTITIPFADHYFAPFYQKWTIQYVIPVTYRFIRVTYPEGTVRDIQCSGLTEANFTAMMSEIITVSEKFHEEQRSLDSNAPAALVEGPEGPELPFGGIRFNFPKEQWKKKLNSDFLTKSVIFVLVCSVFFIAIIAAVISRKPMSGELLWGISIAAGFCLILYAVVIMSFRKKYSKTIRMIPGIIRIENLAIQIDDQKFAVSEIQRLHMSPETFASVSGMPLGLRKMKIETSGRNCDYILGHFYMSKSTILYQDYGELLAAVNVFLKQAGKEISWIGR
ncbi:MAG: hypothetical protein PHP22_12810 [Oscillospiraceae bacterium]|nr:hypothetical protein [Oscillospiraceae bacterium]